MARVISPAPATAAEAAAAGHRNPGPIGGYALLQICDRWLPRWLVAAGVAVGVEFAIVAMPAQRAHSAKYLSVVLGRAARWSDVRKHFRAFAEFLLTKLRAGGGGHHRCSVEASQRDAFLNLAQSPAPALFGTMHFGNSDLLGFLLSDFRKRVAIVRLRVGNSRDTRDLGRRFQEWIEFVWVNEPANIPFAIKDAIDRGASVAMKCDRPEFSARLETFEFLGARRMFPFTIYHVAMVFGLPVIHCVGRPDGRDATMVHASPVFRPSGDRAADLARAREHFQAWLRNVETWLRRDPELWFNFTPLNPVAELT
jgi:predicted LPLAT superfamily acyltransferase